MELFEFRRYFQDGAGPSQSESDSKLNDYLFKLKERKRLREAICSNDVKSENDGSNEDIDRGHKKKIKFDNSDVKSLSIKRRSIKRKQLEEEISSNDEKPSDSLNDLDSQQPSTSCDVREEENFNQNSVNDDALKTTETNQVSTDTPPKKSKSKKKKRKRKETTNEDDSDLLDKGDGRSFISLVEKPVEKTFEVLGAHSFQDKVKVKRILPRWLAEPVVISSTLYSKRKLKDVGKLHRIFVHNLKAMGVKYLFPVQYVVIPHQLQSYDKIHYLWPRDLCVSAPTGSGKTLAYVLPILQAHYIFPKNTIYALVVVPVQELALQVTKVFREVANGTGIKIGCITGGTNRDAEAKNLLFKRDDGSYTNLVNILVATPGRLMEHFYLTPGFNLKCLKFIVIDEADRIVDQKSLNWLHSVEKQCNSSYNGAVPPVTFHNLLTQQRGPQKLLFSATLSQDPEKLLKFNLFQPRLVTSVKESEDHADNDCKFKYFGKFTMPSTLTEKYIICEADMKPLLVHKFLGEGWRKVLVFTKSCIEANRLYDLLKILNPNIRVKELTSLMLLSKRQAAVEEFDQGSVDVLVCSDRMARGIDINDVNYVIIYDPPKYAKGYIHKAGRTGRAGKHGTAVTILAPKQCQSFLNMMVKADKTELELIPFDESELDEYLPDYNKALDSLKSIVSNKKKTELYRTIKEKRTKSTVNRRRRRRCV